MSIQNLNGIKYTEQTLTSAQQAQARQNIGAASTGDAFNWGDMDYSWGLGFTNGQSKNIDDVEYHVVEVLRVANKDTAVKWVVANGTTILKKADDILDGDPTTHLGANEWAWMSMYGGWHLCVCARPITKDQPNRQYLQVNVRLTVNDWSRNYCDRGRVKIFKYPIKSTAGDLGTSTHYNGLNDIDDLAYQAYTMILPKGQTTNVGFANVACKTVVYDTMEQLWDARITSDTVKTTIFNSKTYTVVDNCTAVSKSTVTTVWWLREGYNKIIADDRYHDYQSKIRPFDFLIFNSDGSVLPVVLPTV